MSTLHLLFLEKNSLWLWLQSGCTMQMSHCAAPAVIACVYGSGKNIGSSQSTVSQDRSMLDCMQCLLCLCMCVYVRRGSAFISGWSISWQQKCGENITRETFVLCLTRPSCKRWDYILHQRPPQIRFCLFPFLSVSSHFPATSLLTLLTGAKVSLACCGIVSANPRITLNDLQRLHSGFKRLVFFPSPSATLSVPVLPQQHVFQATTSGWIREPIGWKRYIPTTRLLWNSCLGFWHWFLALSAQAIGGLHQCYVTVHTPTRTHKYTHRHTHTQKKKKGHTIAKLSTLANVRPGLCSGGQLPKVTGCVKTHRSHLHTVCCYPAAISLIESRWNTARDEVLNAVTLRGEESHRDSKMATTTRYF